MEVYTVGEKNGTNDGENLMGSNAVIEILDISHSQYNKEFLWGFALDSPKKGDQIEGERVSLAGWVLGKKFPVVNVEILSEGIVLQRVVPNRHRQDVARVHSEVANAASSGFAREVAVGFLPRKSELSLVAVLEDETRLELGIVEFQHSGQKVPELSPEVAEEIQKSRSRLQEIQQALERSRARLQEMQVDA
jgi:methyl-accepting chemotaxis protein